MSKVIYTSEAQTFEWQRFTPWGIVKDLLKHRSLIVTMTVREFKSAYQASHLGVIWQVILPIFMLAVYYFVFGRILGGKFLSSATEAPVDYALALFVGLGFYNFLAQVVGSSPSLICSNGPYVKTLSFPLEILSVNSVLNMLLTQIIGLVLSALIFLFAKGFLYPSAICVPFYVLSIFLIAVGLSWGLSALGVFFRDISAITPPLMLILMFLCPIFYPMSMVPKKLKWIIQVNPLAIIIEDVRACLLYGSWPSLFSIAVIFGFSLLIAVIGYSVFMRSKAAFADVL